jgi:hypothetical protein
VDLHFSRELTLQANVALSKSFEAPRPAPMAAAPPRRVIGGRWELDKQIGKGSFAVVWRAREVPADGAPDTRGAPRATNGVASDDGVRG